MKLPNGITGFYEGESSPPNTEGKLFKQICYELAREKGGSVIIMNEPERTNFYRAELKMQDKTIHILLNAHYRYVAFASVVRFGQIQFFDQPEWAKYFAPDFQVLQTDELNLPLTEVEAELNRAEWKQIAYWQPKRVGEVIFNFWD